MKLHEYQARDLLGRFGVPILPGEVVAEAGEAERAFEKLSSPFVVVKAQIHAGGRGRGKLVDAATGETVLQGGVQRAKSAKDAESFAAGMLGRKLVTHQTGPAGQLVRRLLVSVGCEYEPQEERYLAVAVDRRAAAPVVIASAEGGVEIEELAAEHPEKILRETVDPDRGLAGYRARRLALGLGFRGELVRPAAALAQNLARLFLDCDASLAEINPLVLSQAGEIVALDAKVNIDESALFRRKELADWRDPAMEDAREIEARRHEISYVGLTGEIGCLVNGAGLAMATMDTIKRAGGEPANFLDVGGGANVEQITAGFRIILTDPKVKAILVNIFGGIMACDRIAEGVLAAVKELGLEFPLVVRLVGNRSEEGRKILAESKLDLLPAETMWEAAQKVVAAVAAAG